MNIGNVAERTGLPTKTIRYYEDIGLITPDRGKNGYRNFVDRDMHKLAFLGRARSLGFSIEDCRTLVALYEDKNRSSADVKRIAEANLDQIRRKVRELQDMQKTLQMLVDHCHGDERPECPILDDFAHLD